jgi:hypothetical protein
MPKLVGHLESSNCTPSKTGFQSLTQGSSMNSGSDWLRGVNPVAINEHHILFPSGSSLIALHFSPD